ncbi:hypothetical protein [Actinomycetospora straminea]|uniref:Uncharacterized protein n=1 Tax=Actinomycetospora straminea TaxID=663607 RepID=A0ABP9ECQ2_9PSEU|nr:hypothetical protein [Actinomycetospora straminea]MDD7934357.1 hypothetical protein [Actinomycetospora straminea]
MTIKLFPAPPRIHGDAEALPPHERSRFRAAAWHARRIYPGPLGELVSRELSAYAEFGYRLSNDGLIPRLATAVLATRADPGGPGSTLPCHQHRPEPATRHASRVP